MRLEIASRRLRLRTPLVAAHGTIDERELLDVRVVDADGAVGCGEAAPLLSYDGVSIDHVHAALEDCRPLLRAGDGMERAELLAACAEAAVLPQAVAALDLALWDLAGRRAGTPVWRLLGAADARPLAVNALIAAEDRAGAAAQASAAVHDGFSCLKLKVGIGDDAGRLAAVRAAVGPDVALRIDANGAWTVEQALANLRALASSGVELCEEPVHGVAELRAVQADSAIPIAMDESASAPGALDSGATAVVCLKLSRCGGITGLLAAAERARSVGTEVYLASTFDGPLGIAGALHAAAAIAPERPCGLATLGAFAELATDPALRVADGLMHVPNGPGLGVRAD